MEFHLNVAHTQLTMNVSVFNIDITGTDTPEANDNLLAVQFGGGEIRGALLLAPEPSTYALMATGLLALGGIARRRRA